MGFIHGDLKPQNILLGKVPDIDSSLYLIDFGITQPFRNDNGSHVLPDYNAGYRGTIAFSSPKVHPMQSNKNSNLMFHHRYVEERWLIQPFLRTGIPV